MGAAWRAASPSAAAIFERADHVLRDVFPRPLSEYVLDATVDATALARTDVAQPAIFVTSIACHVALSDPALAASLPSLLSSSPSPLAVAAGLSLGEYTALTVAGALSFEEALRLVALRARAMQQAADASDGAMLALLGADQAVAAEIVQAVSHPDDVLVAANFNAPGQVVLSGASRAIQRAANFAVEHHKLRVVPLKVAGAFHSPLMEPAANALADALRSTTFNAPSVPVLSNVTAEPHRVSHIADMLVAQLTSPVRWADCCQYIRANFPRATWLELAPGTTLSAIMRKIDRSVSVVNLAQPPVEAQQAQ
ncbi:unnamed protein product [Agarophyton chilense]